MNKKKVYIVTLGCSKNEVDSDLMLSLLDKNSYDIANTLEEAHIIIVNTCGFIESAKEESIETIWEVTKYKDEGNCEYLLLAGCLAQRYSKELMDEIDYIDAIIGTGNIKDLNNILDNLENERRIIKIDDINENYLENVKRMNFSSTAYVKISEGCNNYCTYCIIPKLRGKHRSRKIEDIINEVEYLAENGVKEIILIAQNTSDYGIDLYGEYSLNILLDKLNTIDNIKWIRILYLYPDNFSDKLIESIRDNEKVVKYVDIPLQHVSDRILAKMNRRTNKSDIIELISKLRREIKDIVIRTTFIVGFPGETNDDFQELYEFVDEVKFDKLGVFTYSKEEGTAAYNFLDHIPANIKEKRKDKVMELQRKISEELMEKKVGKTFDVLLEEDAGDGVLIGRTYMDSPEIDGVVYVNTNKDLSLGQYVKVKITDFLEYDLIGELENELSE